MEACHAKRRSPMLRTSPRLKLRTSMTTGMRRNARPPQMSKAILTGSAMTETSAMLLKGRGTAAQVGKTSVTHIKAFASAPPWSRRSRHAKSMNKTTNKSEAVFHQSIPSASPSSSTTSRGVVVWYWRAPATRPTVLTAYQNRNVRSIQEPLKASLMVGRPNTETLA